MQLTDKVALVTGAARGIGRAIAREFALRQAAVIITDIAESGEQTARELRDEGLQAAFRQVDVTDLAQVCAVAASVLDEFGHIDILVNNAGIRPTQPFDQMTLADWQAVLRVNLDGAFNFCSAVLPNMQSNHRGRVINISSLAAQQGSTGGHTHYSASKAALLGLTRSLAREYARFNITVNAIAPGWIDTEGWGGELEGKRQEYAAKVPLGRLGTPEDVAQAAAFLASEQAAYITGVTLPVNGGLYIS